MQGKGCRAVATLHISLLRKLGVQHLQPLPQGSCCSLKAVEMRVWAEKLKCLNHGYKWKKGFEMSSSEQAE